MVLLQRWPCWHSWGAVAHPSIRHTGGQAANQVLPVSHEWRTHCLSKDLGILRQFLEQA